MDYMAWIMSHLGDLLAVAFFLALFKIEPFDRVRDAIDSRVGKKNGWLAILVIIIACISILPASYATGIIGKMYSYVTGKGPSITYTPPPTTTPPTGTGHCYVEFANIEAPTTKITSGLTVEVYNAGTFMNIYDYAKQVHLGEVPDPVATGSYDSSEAKWKISPVKPNSEYQLLAYYSSSTYWIPEIFTLKTGGWVDTQKIGGEIVTLSPGPTYKLAQFKGYQVEKTDGSETAISSYVLKKVTNSTCSSGGFWMEFYFQLGIPSSNDNSRARDFAIFIEVLESSQVCTVDIKQSLVWVEGYSTDFELASINDPWNGRPTPTNVSYTMYRIKIPASVTNEIRRNSGKNINTKITVHLKLYVDWDKSNDATADTFTIGKIYVEHLQGSSYVNSKWSNVYSEKTFLIKVQDNQASDAISYS